MLTAKNKDTVKVHYTGKFKDNSIFDTSTNKEPLEFTIGNNQVIPGFEDAVCGMKEGEKKTSTISAQKAYGKYNQDLVVTISKNDFPPELQDKIEVGNQFELTQPDGTPIPGTINAIAGNNVTLDMNHFLAGKDLIFEIELIKIISH